MAPKKTILSASSFRRLQNALESCEETLEATQAELTITRATLNSKRLLVDKLIAEIVFLKGRGFWSRLLDTQYAPGGQISDKGKN